MPNLLISVLGIRGRVVARVVMFACLICASQQLSAQSPVAYERAGDKAMKEGDYYTASTFYFNSYANNNTDLVITWKLAESCRLYNDYENAQKYYSKAYGLDKQGQFPLIAFYLAEMNQRQGYYEEAASIYANYLQMHGRENSYFTDKAKRELYNCQNIKQLLKDTAKVTIQNSGSEINSVYSDFAPSYLDTTTLLYSSLRFENKDKKTKKKNKYISKLLISNNERNTWSRPDNYSTQLNRPGLHSCNSAVSGNGKLLIYTQCQREKDKLMCTLYYSTLKDDNWSNPQPLNDSINIKGYTATMPAIGNDGLSGYVLYFVSDRPGGIGKADIWKCTITPDFVFSSPINLGTPVNTVDDDITPFYENLNSTLYFASEGHFGLGGFDIYSYKPDAAEQNVVNLHFPINTSYNDLYYSSRNNKFLLSSNRPGSLFIKARTCCYDIYDGVYLDTVKQVKKDTLMIIEPIATDITKDSITKEIIKQIEPLLPMKLYFENDQPNPKTLLTSTKSNYVDLYNVYLTNEKKYRENYVDVLTDESMRNKADAEITAFFNLVVKKSYLDLDRFSELLLKQLDSGNKIEIIVRGSASPLAESSYNKNLSKRRISSVVNYWKIYNAGTLNNYIKTGKLTITEDAVGEELTSAKISDDLKDKRNSIYSPAAGSMRYIQVMRVMINGVVVE